MRRVVSNINKMKKEKTWFLQIDKNGIPFYDDYLHAECALISKTRKNPFIKKKKKI